MMIDPKNLMRSNIRRMMPYSTARDEFKGAPAADLTYLDANENPYDSGYNRYPDPHQKLLKQRIAQIKGVAAANIFVGNGSDEPIDLVYRIFCDPGKDNVISIAPTYGMYKVAAAINDVEFREVQLKDDFSLDIEGIMAATDDHTKLLFLCSPNNPTGNDLNQCDIERLLEDFPGMIVLDEAYIDFSNQGSFLCVLDKYPNLIILQTLSKAWGLAGLRLGLAFASTEVIDIMSRVKYPYNINVVTQKIVLQELSQSRQEQVSELVSQRKNLMQELESISLVKKLYPSDSNFILARFDDPRGIYDKLINEGVIVRDRSAIKGCEGCLRITVGTPEENDKLLEILKHQ